MKISTCFNTFSTQNISVWEEICGFDSMHNKHTYTVSISLAVAILS